MPPSLKHPATAEAGILATSRTGWALLADPLLNKGTAFTETERDAFGLHGLLPPHIGTLEEQVSRRLSVLRRFASDLERYAFLRELHDNNETLFFALLEQNIEEMLPMVYTPTVGAGCQQFSHLFRKPRGLFLSLPHQRRLKQILANPRFDRVEAIVVTDGERILGLGDQGAGGMGIPIGKLAALHGLRRAAPGDDPADHARCRHRQSGAADRPALSRLAPRAGARPGIRRFRRGRRRRRRPSAGRTCCCNGRISPRTTPSRLLARYRDRLCTFNDDIQGTAAVAAGTLLSAINITGVELGEQRVAVLGAGSAGCGIASLLLKMMVEAGVPENVAAARFFMIDRDGLLVDGMRAIEPFQLPFVQKRAAIEGWTFEHPDKIALLDVVRNAKPTVLIGVSGQPGGFCEAVVRAMAEHNRRPVIFPLSNPTSRAEATPADLDAWTEGRAVIGTGSPYPPLTRNGVRFKVDQTNNSYIFPGVGLGAVAVKARHITDAMFVAAAKALAAVSPAAANPGDNLLPPVTALRDVAIAVALATAIEAHREGLTQGIETDQIEAAIRAKMWAPRYLHYQPAGGVDGSWRREV